MTIADTSCCGGCGKGLLSSAAPKQLIFQHTNKGLARALAKLKSHPHGIKTCIQVYTRGIYFKPASGRRAVV